MHEMSDEEVKAVAEAIVAKEPIGSNEEFFAACHKAPETLTERDLKIVGSTHPDWAKQMRQQRQQALEKKAAANATRASQSGLQQHTARVRTSETAFPQADEEWDDYVKRCRTKAAPVAVVDALFDVIRGFIRAVNQKNVTRNERLDALDRRCTDLESQLERADERVKTLEARPAGLEYRGIWRADTAYRRGDFTTHGGSVWHCEQPSTGHRPGLDPTRWKLAVKHGGSPAKSAV